MKKKKRRLLLITLFCFLYLPAAQASFWDDLKEGIKEATNEGIKKATESVENVIGNIPGQESTEENTQSQSNHNADVVLVRATQKELKRIGYEVSVDGAYGPGTRKAIMQFESDNGLNVIGNVSPQLLEKLKVTKPETSVVKTTPEVKNKPEATNKANAVSAGGSSGKVERLTESDIQADRSLFIKSGGEMATADSMIAECTKARDPVLRENFITILNAQSNGESADVKAVADMIYSYDSAFENHKPIASNLSCTPHLIEKSYEIFAQSQNQWISVIEERAKPKATQTAPSTPSAASQEEDNASFCELVEGVKRNSAQFNALRKKPKVHEKCSCNWTANEGPLICKPLKPQAAQSTPSTLPTASHKNKNASFCRKITRRINLCGGGACWDAPSIEHTRQRPDVNEKCSCNWSANEGPLICKPL